MKEKKKVSLGVYILTIIVFLIIIALLVSFILMRETLFPQEDSNNNVQSSEIEANVVNTIKEETTEIAGFDSPDIEYEEYPEDMSKEKILNDLVITIYSKTIYSYIKNGYKNEDIIKLYQEGDSTEIIERESNYLQFDDKNEIDALSKYAEKISIKVAAFQENYYLFDKLYSEDSSVGETEEQSEIAKKEEISKGPIDDLVKYQWDNLKDVKVYAGTNIEETNYYYQVGKMVIMNGNNTSESDYKSNARAKKIKVTVNGEKEYIFDLKDTNKAQEFNIDYTQDNVEKAVTVDIEVLERYNGEETNDIYISDIVFGISSNIPQGR